MHRLLCFLLALFVSAAAIAQSAVIQTIQINQAIGVQKNNNLKFVAGKDTAVRAFLAAAVTIDREQTSAKIIRNGEEVTTLAPRSYDEATAVVDFLCPSRSVCGNWAAGSYAFEVTVNGATQSTAGTDYNFVDRGTIRILALPVKANYGGNIVPVSGDKWKTFADYVRGAYPVAADKLFWTNREELDASDSAFDLETEAGRANLWEALAKLIPAECSGTPEADGCYNQVFGFIEARPNGYPNGNLQGYTYGKPANIGVATDEDAAATVAHEIGHTYGLGDTYDGGSLHCAVNPAPDEFTGKDFNDQSQTAKCISGRVALDGVSGTKVPAEHHPYEVGGRGALGASAEYMGSGGKQEQFWTTQDAYDHLFDNLAPPPPPETTAQAAPAHEERFIQCFGYIRKNALIPADVRMDPCWTYEDTDHIPNTTGTFMIAAVNAAGTRIASRAMEPEFDPVPSKGLQPQVLEFGAFQEEMQFPAGTTKLQIIRDNNIVREIPVSANAPVVTNVAPQATGVVNGEVTITWDATDADGDTLSYEVLFNPDVTNPESEWYVLMRDLTQRRFTVDFSEMPGGSHAKFGIVATDGINAAEGEGPEFQVAAKAPEVFIEDAPQVFRPDDDIILDGDAFDLQDDDIFESQLEWRSSITGLLGNGTPLIVSLPKGIHTITLTVTNSFGLKGSDSVIVVVTEKMKRRSARH